MQHEHTEHVAAPADAVYAAISDLGNLPRFVPQMTAARPAAGDRVEVDARYEGRTQHGEAALVKALTHDSVRSSPPERRLQPRDDARLGEEHLG